MSPKTVIRNENRKHEVKLGQGEQLAQSPKPDTLTVDIPPPILRKTTTGSGRGAARKTADTKQAAAAAPTARKKARPGSTDAKTPERQRATPRLPARVPADRLWEDDSAVMQRLNALQEQNARLAEQLQRLQPSAPLKGFQP